MDFTLTTGGSSGSGAVVSIESSESRGSKDKGPVEGREVMAVDFTLPSNSSVNDIVDYRKLFPHSVKYALPSKQKRFEGVMFS